MHKGVLIHYGRDIIPILSISGCSRIKYSASYNSSPDAFPGSFQMGILKKLFTSREFNKLVPNKDIVVDGPASGGAKIKASLASDGTFGNIYSPRGEKFTIDKSHLKSEKLSESWFDPRYGVSYKIHTSGTKGIQTYTPPTNGRGNDWILIIEEEE